MSPSGLFKGRVYKIILALTGLTLLVLGIMLFIHPPPLSYDPAQGFLVLRSMILGSNFNTFVSPDQTDISKNVADFYVWWSPGQYLIPYFFNLSTGLNMGHCIGLVVTAAQFSGLAGCYCFYKKIGFSKNIAAISLVFIICQQIFMMPYVYYNGGEVLIFAFEGWFLYGCLALNKTGLKLILFVLLAAFTGFFLKSSFLWVYVAGLCCLWIRLISPKPNLGALVKNALYFGVPAAASFACIYFFFIAKGESPVSAASQFKFTPEAITYPVASPVLAGLSVDERFGGLLSPTGPQLVNSPWNAIIVAIAAVLSVLLVARIITRVRNRNYRLFILVFYSFSVLFFGISYLRQMEISMEPRHFRIVGILITPGAMYLIAEFKRSYKIALAIIFAGLAFNSFFYLISGYTNHSRAARGGSGLTQPDIDQLALNRVMKMDKENRNLTFVLFGFDVGFEIRHNRVITLRAIDDEFNIDDYRYLGHAGPLYIVVPQYYTQPAKQIILSSFPGYKNFKQVTLSPGFVLYTAQ